MTHPDRPQRSAFKALLDTVALDYAQKAITATNQAKSALDELGSTLSKRPNLAQLDISKLEAATDLLLSVKKTARLAANADPTVDEIHQKVEQAGFKVPSETILMRLLPDSSIMNTQLEDPNKPESHPIEKIIGLMEFDLKDETATQIVESAKAYRQQDWDKAEAEIKQSLELLQKARTIQPLAAEIVDLVNSKGYADLSPGILERTALMILTEPEETQSPLAPFTLEQAMSGVLNGTQKAPLETTLPDPSLLEPFPVFQPPEDQTPKDSGSLTAPLPAPVIDSTPDKPVESSTLTPEKAKRAETDISEPDENLIRGLLGFHKDQGGWVNVTVKSAVEQTHQKQLSNLQGQARENLLTTLTVQVEIASVRQLASLIEQGRRLIRGRRFETGYENLADLVRWIDGLTFEGVQLYYDRSESELSSLMARHETFEGLKDKAFGVRRPLGFPDNARGKRRFGGHRRTKKLTG